jgi:hypothetical protein
MSGVTDPRSPLRLEYADASPDVGGEPLRHRVILGVLSLIGSIAAVALVGLGLVMYRNGGPAIERHLGAMSAYTSLPVGLLALGIALAARTRAREARALTRAALASNVAYWAFGAGMLLCWP